MRAPRGADGRRRLVPTGGPGDERLEAFQIELAVGDVDHVAPRLRADHIRAERLPQLRDVDLERVPRPLGRLVAPERLHEAVTRDDVICVEQQDREQGARLPAPDREQLTVGFNLERAEDAKVHCPARP